ncbi:OLC1v1009157C1 [Oldenlandia corymbosa var. corymbosa]|uniref:OLC1v1009157C1 n=1 Tax=Oldenlandia corymbosa var. corymbosa TaxID=529605 RepID=A0AAV1DQM9_OLDCO|nr:OLC1v1009157C1 [Oldenlandia corymbosa var. corymbosa]
MENAELKQLLIETSSKSIMVIKDIDCSLDLTGARKIKKNGKDETKDEMMKQNKREDQEKKSRVTLSGVLNFIDGIWSACGEERIIVFTTNHVKKLDPALIRRGRMDLRIEMSYCDFEAFKVLAKNYLDMDSHPLFGEIRQLLEEYDVCPCDVAENLIPKGESSDHKETCLMGLIEAIKNENKKKHEVVLKEEVQDGNALFPNILEE